MLVEFEILGIQLKESGIPTIYWNIPSPTDKESGIQCLES